MRKVSTLILIIFLLPLPILAGSGNRQPSDQRDKTTTFSFSLDRTFGKSVEVPTRKHKDFPFFSSPWTPEGRAKPETRYTRHVGPHKSPDELVQKT